MTEGDFARVELPPLGPTTDNKHSSCSPHLAIILARAPASSTPAVTPRKPPLLLFSYYFSFYSFSLSVTIPSVRFLALRIRSLSSPRVGVYGRSEARVVDWRIEVRLNFSRGGLIG